MKGKSVEMVGMVILNYNDAKETIEYCNVINNYKILDKIVVVDNASTDDSMLQFENSLKDIDKICIISADVNRGYAAGNNLGINYLVENKYDYIIISNPDIEVEEDTVVQLIEFMNKTEMIGMCAPNEIEWGSPNPMTAWKLPGKRMMIQENFILFSRLHGDTRRYGNMDGDSFQVDCLPGCFFAVSCEAIKAVGGMDEDTFLYCEEQILAYNLIEKGYKNYILPKIFYVHKKSTSIKKNIPQLRKRFSIAYRSNKVYCKKCLKMNPVELLAFDISYILGTKTFILLLSVKNIMSKLIKKIKKSKKS
ncbi:MAG: glycosyltransferase [Butyrivibrio sp.]